MEKSKTRWNQNISSFLLLLFTMSFMCSISAFHVSAATFSGEGKGTVKSPYLLTNAAQVDQIRNHLSAHYKLANNIDMRSIANFVPIGTPKKPFTGTLQCDLDATGKPLYIIKNLQVKVNPAGATLAEKYAGYKEDGSMGWDAAFFGYAEGAKLTNIVVLDAAVSNTVEGRSQMNDDWSTNPGTDDQSAGILVGRGNDLTITGCGVGGTVTSASNHVGGLAGWVTDTKISKSYSYANVTSTGTWLSGGLVGNISGKSSISQSFYSGVFSGGMTYAGAFLGYADENARVTDCWAAGTVKKAGSGCFYGIKNTNHPATHVNTDICKNTYTLAVIEGRKKAQTNKRVTNNNWITDAVGGLEIGFAAGSMEEINAAFRGLDAWIVTDGVYPQLKGVHPIQSSEGYVPLAQTNTNSTVPQEGTVSRGANTVGEGSGGQTVTAPQAEEGSVSVIVDETMMKMSTSEKILIVVLAGTALILIAATVYVIVRWLILLRAAKANSIDIISSTGKREETHGASGETI